VFHTVRLDELIIQTFEYEGVPDEVALEIHRFSVVDGRTRLTQRSVFPSLETRDGALAAGMTGGIEDSMNRLAELLEREV
jgi:uncharacterized protein YndB with AHSA1/START domain